MINSSELAGAVCEEVRWLASNTRMSHEPQDAPLVDGLRFVHVNPDISDETTRLSYLLDRSPLPEPEGLAKVIEEVFWSSTLAEERRPCRPRLVYLPQRDRDRPVHWLSKPEELNRRALRKLAPAHGPLGCMTWALNPSGQPVITGFEARRSGGPSDLIITSSETGAIDAMWNNVVVVALRGGKINRLSRPGSQSLHVAMREIGGILGSPVVPSLLEMSVLAIAKQRHGGALWLVREGCSPEAVVRRKIDHDGRGLIEHCGNESTQKGWVASIAHLAAVDGAVIIDSQGFVLSFGSFIKNVDDVLVVRLLPDGGEETISSSELGGGRHRSAAAFCHTFAPAAAIVVSEDGPISVIMGSVESHGRRVRCMQASPLGFDFTGFAPG